MLLIVGDQYNFEYLGTAPTPCPECHRSPVSLFLARKKLTLYYIPTFSLGATYVLRCRNCGKQWEVDRDAGERLRTLVQRDASGSATQVKPGPAPTTGSSGRASVAPRDSGRSSTASTGPKCRKCSAVVPTGARFCQICGEPAIPRPSGPCPSCGARQDTGRYCSRCGSVLQT